MGALADIERLYRKDKTGMLTGEYISPKVEMFTERRFMQERYLFPLQAA